MTAAAIPEFPAAAVYALAGDFMRVVQATTTRVNFGPGRSHEVLSTPAILCAACAAELYLKCALLAARSHSPEALEKLGPADLFGLLPHAEQSAVAATMAVKSAPLIDQLRRIGGTRDLWQFVKLVADGAVDAAFVHRFACAAQAMAAAALQ